MCRLAAYLGAPISPAPVVFGGDHSLYRQSWAPAELLTGSVNADGYGVAWYTGEGPTRVAEPRPIWFDEALRRVLGAASSRCVVAALRNATPGIPVDRSGLLPLVLGERTFILNGFVPEFRRRHMRALRRTLPDALYAELLGASDSETLFLLAVQAAMEGASPAEALVEVRRRVVGAVGAAGGEAQLTMLLCDGDGLAVLRSSNVEATNSLYVAEAPALAPEGTLVASERLDADPAWKPVPPHHVLEVRSDAEARVRPIGACGP